METTILKVELFTIPQLACNSGKANWIQAGQMVRNQLESKFGKVIEFSHIEFMSHEWFSNQKAQEILERGEASFPFALVNGEIASADKRINVSKISRAVQLKLMR